MKHTHPIFKPLLVVFTLMIIISILLPPSEIFSTLNLRSWWIKIPTHRHFSLYNTLIPDLNLLGYNMKRIFRYTSFLDYHYDNLGIDKVLLLIIFSSGNTIGV